MEGQGQRSHVCFRWHLGAWSWDLRDSYVRYCTRGVISTSLQVFYRWGSGMISNLPNVSLERPETNSKLGLSTPESTFFSCPRLAHPVNLKSPLRPTWASQLATFCTDPSYYSVSIRGLSLNLSLSLCGHFPHPYPLLYPPQSSLQCYTQRGHYRSLGQAHPYAVKCLEMQLKWLFLLK